MQIPQRRPKTNCWVKSNIVGKVLISHVGIAVRNLRQATAVYRMLTGGREPMIEEVPDQRVKVAVFGGDTEGGGRIELLEPMAPDSPIGRFLAKKGEGLHHICIYVDDLELKLKDLKAAGVRLIDNKPRVGAGGCRIAFVHPESCNGVLVELQERG